MMWDHWGVGGGGRGGILEVRGGGGVKVSTAACRAPYLSHSTSHPHSLRHVLQPKSSTMQLRHVACPPRPQWHCIPRERAPTWQLEASTRRHPNELLLQTSSLPSPSPPAGQELLKSSLNILLGPLVADG
jgi:hypothetical protein